jgi:hypothetical protein
MFCMIINRFIGDITFCLILFYRIYRFVCNFAYLPIISSVPIFYMHSTVQFQYIVFYMQHCVTYCSVTYRFFRSSTDIVYTYSPRNIMYITRKKQQQNIQQSIMYDSFLLVSFFSSVQTFHKESKEGQIFSQFYVNLDRLEFNMNSSQPEDFILSAKYSQSVTGTCNVTAKEDFGGSSEERKEKMSSSHNATNLLRIFSLVPAI